MADDVVVKVYDKLADLSLDVREFIHDRLETAFAKAITLCEV